MKRKLFIILFLLLGSVVLLFYLVERSDSNIPNGFNRKIISLNIKMEKTFKLPDEGFSFAGRIGDNIILNFPKDRSHLYNMDSAFNKLTVTKVNYTKDFNGNALNVYKQVLSTNEYLTNPYGDILISNGNSLRYYKFKDFRFDFFQPISTNTLFVRGRYSYGDQPNRSLAKISLTDKVNADKLYPLPNIPNGFFTNDGILQFDEVHCRLNYMYFYRGEILSLDTNLNLIYKTKTIDTVRNGKIKTGIIHFSSNQSRILTTQSEPPKLVNIYITTNGNKMYIVSHLIADNEAKSDFKNSQVIDVYNLENGTYAYSFYIPKYQGYKLKQFQIKGKKIIAIFGAFLVSYEISRV